MKKLLKLIGVSVIFELLFEIPLMAWEIHRARKKKEPTRIIILGLGDLVAVDHKGKLHWFIDEDDWDFIWADYVVSKGR